jgi:hypothetical protein
LVAGAKGKKPAIIKRLKACYDDLASTHKELKQLRFERVVEAVGFFSAGICITYLNGETDKEAAVGAAFNLFVGGNKLGRCVAIKNLLVSYYGYNPRRPKADTFLHHARMYGYRRKDIGLLRLFLPQELHIRFKAINTMEGGLRQVHTRRPSASLRSAR